MRWIHFSSFVLLLLLFFQLLGYVSNCSAFTPQKVATRSEVRKSIMGKLFGISNEQTTVFPVASSPIFRNFIFASKRVTFDPSESILHNVMIDSNEKKK